VNVATTSLSAAQSLYQLTKGRICFVVAIIVWIVVGCVLNQIRTLKRYSWLASCAIWINILVIFLSVGFIAHSPPNYAAAKAAYGIAEGPVMKQAFSSYPLFQRVNGVMNIVYAYGGATIFPQIIAEMRRPMDFLRAFSMAQAVIFTIYIFCESIGSSVQESCELIPDRWTLRVLVPRPIYTGGCLPGREQVLLADGRQRLQSHIHDYRGKFRLLRPPRCCLGVIEPLPSLRKMGSYRTTQISLP
jgi:hypothetical protein